MNVLPNQWFEMIGKELSEPYMHDLFTKLKSERYLPDKSLIFRAFHSCEFSDVSVVILGQDPFPAPKFATGLAFAVENDITDKPKTLINIFKEVELSIGNFIDRSQSSLTGWAKQGVFLLNSILTVPPKMSLGHKGIGWEKFTDAAIVALSNRAEPVVFMLWGNEAKAKEKLIDGSRHLILKASHPSPLGANSGPIGERFIGCRHFSKANEWLLLQKRSQIDWAKLV